MTSLRQKQSFAALPPNGTEQLAKICCLEIKLRSSPGMNHVKPLAWPLQTMVIFAPDHDRPDTAMAWPTSWLRLKSLLYRQSMGYLPYLATILSTKSSISSKVMASLFLRPVKMAASFNKLDKSAPRSRVLLAIVSMSTSPSNLLFRVHF